MEKSINTKSPTITVVDARMGRGKSSAAIQYMNDNKGTKRFMYITPYLSEVDRVCTACDFGDPKSNYQSKSAELKEKVGNGESFAATHALFHLMDEEALGLIQQQSYTLIVDENLDVIKELKATAGDVAIIKSALMRQDDGMFKWIDQSYSGAFNEYKRVADIGSLFCLENALFYVMNPSIIRAFDGVFMLTYMLEGQLQKAYLDYFGFEYSVVGIRHENGKSYFSDTLDAPLDVNYSDLINIFGTKRSDRIGCESGALSSNWYLHRKRTDEDIIGLRRDMRNYLSKGNKGSRMWTAVLSHKSKLIGDRNEYKNDFLQVNARATNNYKKKTHLAYLANRFVNPYIIKFFAVRGVKIDQEAFATAEMLQWIWRSAIREGNPINLFIPSNRMRNLLIGWMEKNGGEELSPTIKKIKEAGRRPKIKDMEQYKKFMAEMEEKKRRKKEPNKR